MAEFTLIRRIPHDQAVDQVCLATGCSPWLFKRFLEAYKKAERKEHQVRRRKDHNIVCDVLVSGAAEVTESYLAKIREGEKRYVWRLVKLRLRYVDGQWSVIYRTVSGEIYEIGK